jgi:hypothetical protein
MLREVLFGEAAPAINNTRKPTRHYIQQTGNARKQEYWSQCKLNRVGNIAKIHNNYWIGTH